LHHELAALPPELNLTCYEADDVLGKLPISSKLNADHDFIEELYQAGRRVARARTTAQAAD
jgi:hypothetical protein